MDVTNMRIPFQVEPPLLLVTWRWQTNWGNYLLAQTKFFKMLAVRTSLVAQW